MAAWAAQFFRKRPPNTKTIPEVFFSSLVTLAGIRQGLFRLGIYLPIEHLIYLFEVAKSTFMDSVSDEIRFLEIQVVC